MGGGGGESLGGRFRDPGWSLKILCFMELSPPETWHQLAGKRRKGRRCRVGLGGVGAWIKLPVPGPPGKGRGPPTGCPAASAGRGSCGWGGWARGWSGPEP